MTRELTYYAKIAPDGTLQGLPKNKFLKEIRQMFSGEQVEITVHKKKKFRSVQENRYYWLIITMLCDQTGYTKMEMHEILKKEFLLATKVNEETGRIYEYVRSTTELSTTEFEDYMEDVRRFGSEEFGIYLPEPNEQTKVFS